MRALLALFVIAVLYGVPIAVGGAAGAAFASYFWGSAAALATYTVIGLFIQDAFARLADK